MKTECLESTEVGTEGNRRLNPGKFFFYLQTQVFKDCFETIKKSNVAVVVSRNQDPLNQMHP